MATFRRYGGTNHSSIANIVRHNMLNSKSSSFVTSGLYNSKETFLSHIDMSGNSILHVGNLYFQDGTTISSGATFNHNLSQVLSYGNSAGSYDINMNGHNITGINSIQINGKTQDRTYTGFNNAPGTYNSATLTFDTSGKITNVIDNSMSPFGLEQVLTKSERGGGKSINDVSNIVFSGSLTQTYPNTNTNTNKLNSTVFNDLCSYSTNLTFNDNNDIPNKGYVDTVASGLTPTALCNCATTQDISLSGLNAPTIIDGVTLANKYRVLVKCQDSSNNVSSSNFDNGIYVYYYDTSGSLIRAPDCSGNDVSSQLTFISDGSLNGMKAFVQTNSPAIAGTNPLNYVPFYSLNYNLGRGLELVGGSTLQVESSLNFLSSVVITNNSTPINNAFKLTNTAQTKQIFASIDLSGTNYNDITQLGDNGIFSGNGSNPGTNLPPLVLSTWSTGQPSGIRITNNSVKLQSDSSNWYELSGGHNFYGNITMNSSSSTDRQITTSNLNLSPINGPAVATGTQIYQGPIAMTIDNNINTISNYESCHLFACNNLGDNSKKTTPLSFNSSLFMIDLSNNLTSTSIVKYQACNNLYYGNQGIKIGHNFYGNMYLNTLGNSLQFPDATIQTTAYDPSSNISNIISDSSYTLTNRLITPIQYANFYDASFNENNKNDDGFYKSIGSINLIDGNKYLITYKCSISQIGNELILQCAGILVDSPTGDASGNDNSFIQSSDSYCNVSESYLVTPLPVGTTFSFGTTILYTATRNTNVFLKYGVHWTSERSKKATVMNGYISYIKV
jgi:hypothetical protein